MQGSNGRRQASLSDSISKTSAERRKSTAVSYVIDLFPPGSVREMCNYTHIKEGKHCNTCTVHTNTRMYSKHLRTWTRTHTHTWRGIFMASAGESRRRGAERDVFPSSGFLEELQGAARVVIHANRGRQLFHVAREPLTEGDKRE